LIRTQTSFAVKNAGSAADTAGQQQTILSQVRETAVQYCFNVLFVSPLTELISLDK